jgi:hypothetical protein
MGVFLRKLVDKRILEGFWLRKNGRRSGVFEDFLDGGFAKVNVAEAILAERVHAELDGLLTEDEARGAACD